MLLQSSHLHRQKTKQLSYYQCSVGAFKVVEYAFRHKTNAYERIYKQPDSEKYVLLKVCLVSSFFLFKEGWLHLSDVILEIVSRVRRPSETPKLFFFRLSQKLEKSCRFGAFLFHVIRPSQLDARSGFQFEPADNSSSQFGARFSSKLVLGHSLAVGHTLTVVPPLLGLVPLRAGNNNNK